MTYEEASRLITMLQMNFAAFLPAHPEAAAMKKGMWVEELIKHDYADGMRAVKEIIGLLQYPPTMADFKNHVGAGAGLTRDDLMARLPGPTIDDFSTLYTADMKRVDRIMAELDQELARLKTFDTGGKHGTQNT